MSFLWLLLRRRARGVTEGLAGISCPCHGSSLSIWRAGALSPQTLCIPSELGILGKFNPLPLQAIQPLTTNYNSIYFLPIVEAPNLQVLLLSKRTRESIKIFFDVLTFPLSPSALPFSPVTGLETRRFIVSSVYCSAVPLLRLHAAFNRESSGGVSAVG